MSSNSNTDVHVSFVKGVASLDSYSWGNLSVLRVPNRVEVMLLVR